jgi:peptidoglycan/LPS O-acetylase OafA/YrhL
MVTALTAPIVRQSRPEATDRNIAIDWLRGAAAIAVLGYHARAVLWVGVSSWLQSGRLAWFNIDFLLGMISIPFRWGDWGVPLFFVISGYCIHRPYVNKRNSQRDYRLKLSHYFARRVWRIYPTLVAALILTAALDQVVRWLNPTDSQLGDNSLYCFVVNLLSLQNIAAPTYGSNVPLWTLSIELHFYLLYPLLYGAIKKVGLLIPALVVLGLSVGSWLMLELAGSHSGGFFLPYWFTWFVGAYIAEAEARPAIFPTRWLAIAAVPSLMGALALNHWKFGMSDTRPMAFICLSLPFALLVWYAIQFPTSRLWTCRASRAIAFVGLFSYSLYATHLPTLVAYRAIILGGGQSSLFVSVIPAALVAVAVAYVMYVLVERWSLRLPAGLSRWLNKNEDSAARKRSGR